MGAIVQLVEEKPGSFQEVKEYTRDRSEELQAGLSREVFRRFAADLVTFQATVNTILTNFNAGVYTTVPQLTTATNNALGGISTAIGVMIGNFIANESMATKAEEIAAGGGRHRLY